MFLPDGHTDVPAGKLATVVTTLEMSARVASRPDPAPAPWALRAEPRPGLDWYRDLYRRVGEDWLWFSRLRMGDAALAAILHDPAVAVFALSVEGRDEGLLELDFREPDVCELAFFGVTTRQIGNGAGRWMMNRAIELAWARPIRRFWVHTCTLDHPGALDFYRRSGFVPCRRQIEIADDPRVLGEAPRTAAPHVPIL